MKKKGQILKRIKLGRSMVKIPDSFLLFSKLGKRRSLIFLLVVILAGLLYLLKGQFIVATVNGQPIWRTTLINQLEKQGGKNVLDSIITKTLILQEARKQKVVASDDEVAQEIEKIEVSLAGQGQNLDQVLGAQGINKEELREQIRIQKVVEKILGDEIEITQQEIEDFVKENKSFLPQDLTGEELRESAQNQLRQQKINEKIGQWLETLHGNAKINYFRNF